MPCAITNLHASTARRARHDDCNMKGLAWLITIFSLAVLASLIARYSEGYVLVMAPPWRIELSLVAAAALLAAAFVLLHLVLRLVGGIMSLPRQAQAFRSRKQTEKGRAA